MHQYSPWVLSIYCIVTTLKSQEVSILLLLPVIAPAIAWDSYTSLFDF